MKQIFLLHGMMSLAFIAAIAISNLLTCLVTIACTVLLRSYCQKKKAIRSRRPLPPLPKNELPDPRPVLQHESVITHEEMEKRYFKMMYPTPILKLSDCTVRIIRVVLFISTKTHFFRPTTDTNELLPDKCTVNKIYSRISTNLARVLRLFIPAPSV